MSPAELKRLNIRHFERLLVSERDPGQRAVIERLLAEEQAKDDSAYPEDNAPTGDKPPLA
jgi:hypothetical protein